MSRLQKILLLTGAALVFTGLAIFILYPIFADRGGDEVVIDEPTAPSPADITPLPPDNSVPLTDNTVLEPLTGDVMPTDEATTRSQIEQLARFFVERFGTYSNFNYDFTTTLDSFMTPSMSSYADSLVQRLQEEDGGRPITDYFGVSTRILSAKVQSLQLNNSASLDIIIQEEVQLGINTPVDIYRRDGRIDLVYIDGQWLVNGLFYN